MSDRFQADAFDAPPPDLPEYSDVSRPSPPLPPWLARRLLQDGETVAWVRGPRFNPSWERYVTHIGLFGAALAAGAFAVAVASLLAEFWPPVLLPTVLVAGALVLASIMVLGLCCGYFTRLVATNHRLVILQGYEVCRTWGMDDLPPFLIRHDRSVNGERSRTVDFDAVKNMLGGSSDQFVDAKTILAFGKQLGHIKAREDGRA